MSGHCCGHDNQFDGADPAFRRALKIVIAINIVMFVVEMVMGHIARSQALQADALDFFADAITYSLSLAVIGCSALVRSRAALAKGISLLLMALWVMGSTLYRVFVQQVPEAVTMGSIGFLALLANLASVFLLIKWKEGDANVRSVWLCSRNDAISNVAVMVAAFGVFGTATAWPDLIVAGVMAGLFLSSAVQILHQATSEMKEVHHHD